MKPTIINLLWKELGYPRQNFWASAEAKTRAEIFKAREMVKAARLNNGVHNLRVKIHRGLSAQLQFQIVWCEIFWQWCEILKL